MSGSLNKVMIIGNMGKDPEIRVAQGGGKVATLSLATSERWTDKGSGERQEKTEWHRVVIFGKGADAVEKYTRKGSKLFVEGRLQTRSWEDKTSGQTRFATEIVGDKITFLDSKPQGGGNSEPAKDDAPFNDEIPF